MGGDIEQLNATQMQACRAEVQEVREAVVKYHASAWHFVVVCDEASWKDYASFSGTPASVLENASADTNRSLNTIFIRGARWNEVLAENLLTTQVTARPGQQPQQLASNNPAAAR
jgi:nitroreductase